MSMLNKFFAEHSDWSILFVRIGVGLVLFTHGIGKLLNIGPWALGLEATTGFFVSVGIPFAGLMAVVVGLIETLGGLMMFVGLFTRVAALLSTLVMAGAFFTVHLANGFSIANNGYEFVLLIMLSCVSLLLSGPGNKLVLEKVVRPNAAK
jgi:putative oxidoreductase